MIKIIDIAKTVNAIRIVGNPNGFVEKMKSIDDRTFSFNDLAWCSDKNRHSIENINCGTLILSEYAYHKCSQSEEVTFIVVNEPRKAFQKILVDFFVEKPIFGQISPSSDIDSTVKVDRTTVNVGRNVVIEKGCSIGINVTIHANTVIKSNTEIADNVSIGCNCTIGGVGFGYELNDLGEYEVIPHIGNVVLSKNVEIGNNVCIDRAVLGSTFLAENVKVDNLVHIAHGVQIGKNSLIIANAMIAGSVEIGENVWVSPSTSIRQKLVIGDKSLVGMGAVVVKSVKENEIVAGNPAKVFPKK